MEEQEYLIEDNKKDDKKQEKENEKNSGNKDEGKSNMEEKERSDTTNHRKRYTCILSIIPLYIMYNYYNYIIAVTIISNYI